MTGIDARPDEIWVGPVHLSGPMEIQDDFELHPRTMLELLPTSFRFDHQGGKHSFSIGRKPLSVDAELDVQVKLPPFYFKKENHLLDLVRFHAEARFLFKDLSSLDPLLPRGRVEFHAHDGELEVDAGLKNAHFDRGSGVTFRAKQADVELKCPPQPDRERAT